MARQIRDAAGTEWTVYLTIPSATERRAEHLADAYRHGWLVFESTTEKRRLAPVPTAWDELSDAGLAALCDSATPQPVHRRAAVQAPHDRRTVPGSDGPDAGAQPQVFRRKLDAVTTRLGQTLEQVCEQRDAEQGPHELDTGELIRVEETLATAAEMAKEAVTLRRKLRASDHSRSDDAGEKP